MCEARKVAIIQARMDSQRLPGKVLIKIKNKPILQHIIERIAYAKLIDKVVVATTVNPMDDVIEQLCHALNVNVYRGSESNVLERFYFAALKYSADIIIRITADDPLKDPEVIDKAVQIALSTGMDYVSNTIKPTYPDGIDVEVFTMKALEKAYHEAKLPSEQEHVTPYIWKNSTIFKHLNFECKEDLSSLRWTLDNENDLKFIEAIYDRLYHEDTLFKMNNIIDLLDKEPELLQINKDAVRNEGYLKSLKGDISK